MTYREIVHTCSHSEVARAAVDSIGGAVALKVAAETSRRRISRGALVVELVGRFAASADDAELQGVSAATHKSDAPVLSGLRYILEREISKASLPAWMISACSKSA